MTLGRKIIMSILLCIAFFGISCEGSEVCYLVGALAFILFGLMAKRIEKEDAMAERRAEIIRRSKERSHEEETDRIDALAS